MHARIKILTNYEAIQKAADLALPKSPLPEYGRGDLYFSIEDVHHFYIDGTVEDDVEIYIYLNAHTCFRAEYDENLAERLKIYFGE